MAEKGPQSGGERVAISYKMPLNIYEKVNKLVYEEKKFSTAVSDWHNPSFIILRR